MPPRPRLGDLEQLAGYVETHHISQVWVVLPMSAQDEIARILDVLAHSTADIKFVPDLLGLQLLNHSVEQVAGLPVINLRASPLDGDARLLKALEDRVLAALILLLIAPLLAVIALGVKLSSPGPVLFRQQRHGLDGKVIEVWKFRSMRVHAGGARQGHAGHAATTRASRRSAASCAAPASTSCRSSSTCCRARCRSSARARTPSRTTTSYKTLVQDYMQRHRVKPGITGWAQVNGLRGETDTVDKMAARVEYDLYYMQNWSLWLDLQIVALTVLKGFLGKNAY